MVVLEKLILNFISKAAYENMKGYVYLMKCADMPALHKIGLSVSAFHRLRQANSPDTFRPPAGYTYAAVLRVDDMREVERHLHDQFGAFRQPRANGKLSEFFAVDELTLLIALAGLDGDFIPLSSFNTAAEAEERRAIRAMLRDAIWTCRNCTYGQENPKHVGTKSYTRYDAYKGATTLDESLRLGTFEDIVYDYFAGFFHLG